jgi:hypothetical protein
VSCLANEAHWNFIFSDTGSLRCAISKIPAQRDTDDYPFAGEFWIFDPVAFASPVSANHWLGKPHQIYIDIVTDPFWTVTVTALGSL